MKNKNIFTECRICLLALVFGLLCMFSCTSITVDVDSTDASITEYSTAEKDVQDTETNYDEETDIPEGEVDITRNYKYKVRGKRYDVFANAKNFQEIGMASWYGPGFHGKTTASGEPYNMHDMTAAHKTLPLGSEVLVIDLTTGNAVIVRINDRGPFHQGRVIDLSRKAAEELGILKKGSARVHVKAIN